MFIIIERTILATKYDKMCESAYIIILLYFYVSDTFFRRFAAADSRIQSGAQVSIVWGKAQPLVVVVDIVKVVIGALGGALVIHPAHALPHRFLCLVNNTGAILATTIV
jgi:hypothetical protein